MGTTALEERDNLEAELEELVRSNETLMRENELFESYLQRANPSLLAEDDDGGAKRKQMASKKLAQTLLTAEQKYDIAANEMEEVPAEPRGEMTREGGGGALVERWGYGLHLPYLYLEPFDRQLCQRARSRPFCTLFKLWRKNYCFASLLTKCSELMKAPRIACCSLVVDRKGHLDELSARRTLLPAALLRSSAHQFSSCRRLHLKLPHMQFGVLFASRQLRDEIESTKSQSEKLMDAVCTTFALRISSDLARRASRRLCCLKAFRAWKIRTSTFRSSFIHSSRYPLPVSAALQAPAFGTTCQLIEIPTRS
eukprot:6192757-Pleurochrysis_carterae.AAC.2